MNDVVLRTVNLTKRYGDLTAVDGLSLEVRAGEVFGFLGPNGAGKTTAISMMCGLLRPDAGQTFINGEPVHAGECRGRLRVGVCPQQIVVWPSLTCLEQMAFVGEMYGTSSGVARRRSLTLLEAMGLADKRDKLAKTLSGGMLRRLNLIMALVHDPEILVLDEPEAGLDPQSRVLVREYVRSLARKKTVILTTHNMDEADRLADRVAIIDHGRLLTLDAPEALKRQVGQGDVLELTMPAAQSSDGLRLIALLREITPSVGVSGDTLLIRAHGVVELLPRILDALRTVGCPPREVRLRESTLEDVFIALTGRRLRE